VYIAHTDANGAVTDPRAKYVIDLVTAKQATPAPNFDPLSVVIGVNVIPECAMKVTRSFEGGDLSLYSSPAPCGCFYESLKGTPSSSCQACPNDGDCATGVCRHGYCEAR
jgi:hypothetical protein